MTEYDYIELRRFAVDKALEYHRQNMTWFIKDVVYTAAVIEHYLLTGKILVKEEAE